MPSSRTVFAELMTHVSHHKFQTCVARYGGDDKAARFSCWDQYLCMAFAQLTYRESLRDIEACLRAVQSRLYHVGIRARISRSTLADANETRDWRIYADFAQGLIRTARDLYVDDPLAVDLANTVYALDATIIDLCLSVFPWAHYRRRDAALKLHTQLDLRGMIPTIVQITEGKRADVTFLDDLIIEPGAIYLMDRGYVDFARLHRFVDEAAFFVTRTKRGIRLRRRVSRPVDFATGLISDHTVGLVTADARRAYPEALRRVRYVDPKTKKRLAFLTNNFTVPALTIAHLYRSRWAVELFFRWIKSHLRLKAFYGTSENAVKTQIWIALSVYVLVAIVKKRLALDVSLYKLLQILSVTLFEKTPISIAVFDAGSQLEDIDDGKQLELFNL
ncbi:MAG TPA: IS4 family transposase [Vicinamibacterales bacterium]|nr:IS4 family transposase [Vicinamibacterales bacterium]